MLFSSLRTAFFRNLDDKEINTSSKDIFLVGENGQGKTNFLEALYYCAYASSFRSINENDIARNGEKEFSTEVKFINPDKTPSINKNILIKFEKGKKSIYIDGKKVEDRRELLSVIPCIIFCHEDMDFVKGSPEKRRWFFDQTLSLYDPIYLEDFRRYRYVLRTRNAVLRDYVLHKNKKDIEAVLDSLDPQLAIYGQNIMEKREMATKKFSDVLCPLYDEVAGISGIKVQYNRSWKAENDIYNFLCERRTADMAAGITLSGPHRDRYIFTQTTVNDCKDCDHKNVEFAGKASTGQRRLLALLLRAAQSLRFSEVTGMNPVLLLDDVLLEMDGEKRRKFLTVLPVYDQAFFTFLPEEPYRHYSKEDTLIYRVQDGKTALI